MSTSDSGASGVTTGQRSENIIQIRTQLCSGRKTLTTVQVSRDR